MSAISFILLAALVISVVVAFVIRKSFWFALVGVLGLFLVASLGWLWWWVPIVAAGITLLIYLIGLLAVGFGRVALGTVAVIAIVASAVTGLVASGVTQVSPAAADGGIDSIAFDPEVDFLPAEAKCDTNLFVDHSVRTVEAGNPEKKQFPTAVSIPFTGTDDKSVMTELTKTEICGNPTELEMVVNDMLLWSSEDIPGADENKGWLNTIKADIDGNPLGINSFVEKSPTGVLTVTATYQKYAAWVNTVLLRSVAEGQQSLTSVRNWEVSAVADPSKGLPSAQQAAVQENKPAWVRSYIDKMGNCLLRFGFNVEDRRMEIFACETPAPPTPENPGTPENPPGGGGCESNCEPPPSFECPPDQPHKAWSEDLKKWICKDDPSRDPEQQGNNRPGGGGSAPAVTEPASPPAAGDPPATYEPPAPVQTQAPVVPVQPNPQPTQTVAPATDPPSDGHVVLPSPGPTCVVTAFNDC